MSAIFRQSIINNISNRSKAEFAYYTRLNAVLMHPAKNLTRISARFLSVRSASPHPDVKLPPLRQSLRGILKIKKFSTSCPQASLIVHIYYRGCNRPRAILRIRIYKHQQRKQRQVTLSLFPRYLRLCIHPCRHIL